MKGNDSSNNQPLPRFPYLCQPPAILALVLIGQLLAVVLVLADSSSPEFWPALGATSMIVQWIVLCSTLILCLLHTLLNRLPMLQSGSLAFAACLAVSAVVLWLAQTLRPEPFNFIVWIKSLLIAVIFSGILLRYLYLQQQLGNQQQAELQARIQSLQARIRPHFLFNSMNTVASLITVNPAAAEKTLEDLSHLFRSSLQSPGLVSLEKEIELCRHYIAIEQRRLAQRLTMRWNFTEPLPDIQVPSLMLQPLLENAIHHGIQRLPGGGTLTLGITQQSGWTNITIDNPVAIHSTKQATKTRETGNQIALDNIRHRLQLYFGKQASLDINHNDRQQHFQVVIILPDTAAHAVTGR